MFHLVWKERESPVALKVNLQCILPKRLRPLGVLSRAEKLRGGLMAAAAPHREWKGSAELCSV